MATVTNPLADDARKVTGEALQGSLVDLIDLFPCRQAGALEPDRA